MDLDRIVSLVDIERLYQHVLRLQGIKHALDTPEKLKEAADYIYSALESYGAAVRMHEGGYRVTTLRAQRFERDVWLRRAGLNAPDGLWQEHQSPQEVLCDALGCVYQGQGDPERVSKPWKVGFVLRPEALLEDCHRLHVLVLLGDAMAHRPEDCGDVRLISAHDLKIEGTHAIWLDTAAVRVETVKSWWGRRPWTAVVTNP